MGEAARKLDDAWFLEDSAQVYVSVDVFSDHNFWTGLTMNMSEGGIFVATHNVAPIGATVVIHLMLPFESEAVVTLAEVRWTRDYTGNDDAPPGLGLEFVGIDEASLEKVRAFVATVREPLYFES